MLCYKEIVEFDPFKIPCLQQGHTIIYVTYIYYIKYI